MEMPVVLILNSCHTVHEKGHIIYTMRLCLKIFHLSIQRFDTGTGNAFFLFIKTTFRVINHKIRDNPEMPDCA